jgi:AcrR family transcriptional regulator
MARPRKVSDDDVFAAAYRVMQRVHPSEFTLDAIARETGVTAGALVQRFGSKRELLLRLAEGAATAMPELIGQIRARHRSPLAALRDYAACMAELAPSPDAYVRNLAYLLEDLTDPGLRKQLGRQQRATRAALEEMIRDAVREGELTPAANAASLARTIESLLGGSLLTWAFHRDGAADAWLRRDLDAVLAPYLVRRRKSTSTTKTARRDRLKLRRAPS